MMKNTSQLFCTYAGGQQPISLWSMILRFHGVPSITSIRSFVNVKVSDILRVCDHLEFSLSSNVVLLELQDLKLENNISRGKR